MLKGTFKDKKYWENFIERYSRTSSYWYVPKPLTVKKRNIGLIRNRLKVLFNHFSGKNWDLDKQLEYHRMLLDEGLIKPYKKGEKRQDVAALSRINITLFEFLGFAWVEVDEKGEGKIAITRLGNKFIESIGGEEIIENQIMKIQFPNVLKEDPQKELLSDRMIKEKQSIVPFVFLLQILKKCDYWVSEDEFKYFINLAERHEDIRQVKGDIEHWRQLSFKEKEIINNEIKVIIRQSKKDRMEKITRYYTIEKNFPYQRSLFTFPRIIKQDRINGEKVITCRTKKEVNELLKEILKDFEVINFRNLEDWIEYFTDEEKGPRFQDALGYYIETSDSKQQAKEVIEKRKGQIKKLDEREQETIKAILEEKYIEDLYVKHLDIIEDGLKLFFDRKNDKDGRQYSTDIGRIDLLCIKGEEFVVIEIKAGEADDKALGQLLRYMGWVYQNIEACDLVRGIILAESFSDRVIYARIGMMKEDAEMFLSFKEVKLKPRSL